MAYSSRVTFIRKSNEYWTYRSNKTHTFMKLYSSLCVSHICFNTPGVSIRSFMSTVFVAYCHFGVALLTVISSGLGSIPLDEISDGTLEMHLVGFNFHRDLCKLSKVSSKSLMELLRFLVF